MKIPKNQALKGQKGVIMERKTISKVLAEEEFFLKQYRQRFEQEQDNPELSCVILVLHALGNWYESEKNGSLPLLPNGGLFLLSLPTIKKTIGKAVSEVLALPIAMTGVYPVRAYEGGKHKVILPNLAFPIEDIRKDVLASCVERGKKIAEEEKKKQAPVVVFSGSSSAPPAKTKTK